jgi:hypothetical protein
LPGARPRLFSGCLTLWIALNPFNEGQRINECPKTEPPTIAVWLVLGQQRLQFFSLLIFHKPVSSRHWMASNSFLPEITKNVNYISNENTKYYSLWHHVLGYETSLISALKRSKLLMEFKEIKFS